MWSSAGLYSGTKASAEQASLDMGNSIIVLVHCSCGAACHSSDEDKPAEAEHGVNTFVSCLGPELSHGELVSVSPSGFTPCLVGLSSSVWPAETAAPYIGPLWRALGPQQGHVGRWFSKPM